jgi:hypothetical protein
LFAVGADGKGLRQITHADPGERFFAASPHQDFYLISRAVGNGPWKIGWLSGDGKSFTAIKGSNGKPLLGVQPQLQR